MRLPLSARDIPGRVTTGGYVLHSGLTKLNGKPETAQAFHRMAVGAFPFLKDIPPEKFLRMVAIGEIAVGAGLLLPVIPSRLAGFVLSGFSGGLLTMYLRTPSMHKEGSIWPTPAGVALSKDVWMLGVGLDLLVGSSD